MTKSERLLSVFSENYFFKELVIDDLCFTPNGSSEKELADLIINLGDTIIAIQLKERNESDQSGDPTIELGWLGKRGKKAKKQVKETMQYIASGSLPTFLNKRGHPVILNPTADVIPLVIFDNDMIDKYPHLLRQHSDSGMNINCMSFSDYQEMCRVLVSPIEIIAFLDYRKTLYAEHGDIDIMVFEGAHESIITKPMQNESLVYSFLAETYGILHSYKHTVALQRFRKFMHHLPNHTVNCSAENGIDDILLFLARLNREETFYFWKRLEYIIKKSKGRKSGIFKSLRRGDGEFAIIFTANDDRPMSKLLQLIRQKGDVKRALKVNAYLKDSKSTHVEFIFWDGTKKHTSNMT